METDALNAYITEGRKPQDYVDYARKDADGIVRGDLLLTMSERLNKVIVSSPLPEISMLPVTSARAPSISTTVPTGIS